METLTESSNTALRSGRPRIKRREKEATHSAAPKSSHAKFRISLDVNQAQNDRLDAIAEEIGISKSDVLRRALALLDRAVKESKAGNRIGFLNESDQMIRELVWLDF